MKFAKGTYTILITILLSHFDFAVGSIRKLQVPSNDVCESAIFVNASDVRNGTVMIGSTKSATPDTFSCVVDEVTAVYYKFTGNGARYRVTTCHEATDFDSAIWVDDAGCGFFGCGDLQSDVCEDGKLLGATVEFYSEPDTIYIVAVGGTSTETSGNFALSIQEFVTPENNFCSDSILIQPTLDASVIVKGSTANATYDVAPCEIVGKASVYYKLVGTGSRIRISTCNKETNFDSALALFDNANCELCPLLTNDYDFDCDAEGMASTIEFVSEPDVVYTFAVRGVAETDMGDFGLSVQEFVRPSNDVCIDAIIIEPVTQPSATTNGGIGDANPITSSSKKEDSNNMSPVNTTTVAYGSTTNSTSSSFLCVTGSYSAAYYLVKGTGQRMRVSTCTEEVPLNFDSVIHVDAGRCGATPSGCSSMTSEHDVACESSPTGFASTVEWETEPDTMYTITVRGLSEDARGEFGLSLEAFGNVTKEGDGCRWVQVCDAI